MTSEDEGVSINRSLTTLGRIFAMLSDRKARDIKPPYRESKLTRLLQESLQQDSKIVMIVNVWGDQRHCRESKLSLEFAQNATNNI
jgi:hypothetical protein